MKLIKLYHIIVGFLPFSFLRIMMFNFIRHNKISYSSKLGWGFYGVDKIVVQEQCKIDSFNFFYINTINLTKKSYIKQMNLFKGPFDVVLGNESGISRSNKFTKAKLDISRSITTLELGDFSFIVNKHFFDLTRNIRIGSNSIIAGIGSQLWTHGYYHANSGRKRIRIDGDILIGNNVYIGSRSIVNPGIEVKDSINVGSGSVISKSLKQKGMYVNQPLRFIENNISIITNKLEKVNNENLIEEVYHKSL